MGMTVYLLLNLWEVYSGDAVGFSTLMYGMIRDVASVNRDPDLDMKQHSWTNRNHQNFLRNVIIYPDKMDHIIVCELLIHRTLGPRSNLTNEYQNRVKWNELSPLWVNNEFCTFSNHGQRTVNSDYRVSLDKAIKPCGVKTCFSLQTVPRYIVRTDACRTLFRGVIGLVRYVNVHTSFSERGRSPDMPDAL